VINESEEPASHAFIHRPAKAILHHGIHGQKADAMAEAEVDFTALGKFPWRLARIEQENHEQIEKTSRVSNPSRPLIHNRRP
jgi:hypothetical protein